VSGWVPANQPVAVAGYRIAAGLVYFGQSCRSAAGTVEPAQINPGLPVDPPSSRGPVHDPGPAPAYHLISSAHRAAYLRWLARGRSGDDVPPGLLQLFCSGLERRVLLDARTDPAARDEFGAIAAELRRLRELYGPRHPAFGTRVTALLEVLDLLVAPSTPPFPASQLPASQLPASPFPASPPVGGALPVGVGPPPLRTDDVRSQSPPVDDCPPPILPDAARWPVPIALRIRLAQLANAGRPVPPDWARCWAWYHPALFPTTPQTRCPTEFDRLFALRYRRRLPSGVVPEGVDRPPVRIGYQPINPAMDTVVVERPELPDVLEDPAATRQLAALLAEVGGALTPYSRWLGRTPGGRDTVASTMLLPDDLLREEPGPLGPLAAWVDDRLGAGTTAVVDAGELAPFWSSADPRRMSRDEASSFAVVLARLGLGVEPDVRFVGPPLGSGPLVLFRLGQPGSDGVMPVLASDAYRAACHVLSVVAAIWPRVADPADPATTGPGPADPATTGPGPDRDVLVNGAVTALAAELPLSLDERTRLGARLRWLFAAGVDLRPVRRRSGSLAPEQRDAGARVLLRLAVESGEVGPAQVAALTTGYRLLGLPEDLLYPQLHQVVAGRQSGATDPGQLARSGRSTRTDRVPMPVCTAEPAPVVARRGRSLDIGHPLPWARPLTGRPDPAPARARAAGRPEEGRPEEGRPEEGRPEEGRPEDGGPEDGGPEDGRPEEGHSGGGLLCLEQETLGRRLTETAVVDALLAEVFDVDPDPHAMDPVGLMEPGIGETDRMYHRVTAAAPAARSHEPDSVDVPREFGTAGAATTAGATTAGPAAGLDPRHRGLLAEVASRSSWTGAQLTRLAARHGVLPAGALDLINELAIERAGQAVVEVDVAVGGSVGGDDAVEDAGSGRDGTWQEETWVVDLVVARELLG
jgi:hypothetical protein